MGLYDPGAEMAMANTAEELGRRYEITREQADEFGYRSHMNAKAGARRGLVRRGDRAGRRCMVDGAEPPIDVKHDTHIMDNISLAKMARLRAAFEPGGIITAGNASAVVDGGAAMVIGKESDAEKHGLQAAGPHRRHGRGGLRSADHGLGPGARDAQRAGAAPASRASDLDHVELNEAFAPQALACIRDFEEMGIDPEKVNPMGNAIALGHPLGATGAILTLTCAYALRRKKERYGAGDHVHRRRPGHRADPRSALGSALGGREIMEEIFKHIDDNLDARLQQLFEWLRIPASARIPAFNDDCRKAAQWLVDQLTGGRAWSRPS